MLLPKNMFFFRILTQVFVDILQTFTNIIQNSCPDTDIKQLKQAWKGNKVEGTVPPNSGNYCMSTVNGNGREIGTQLNGK